MKRVISLSFVALYCSEQTCYVIPIGTARNNVGVCVYTKRKRFVWCLWGKTKNVRLIFFRSKTMFVMPSDTEFGLCFSKGLSEHWMKIQFQYFVFVVESINDILWVWAIFKRYPFTRTNILSWKQTTHRNEWKIYNNAE